MKKKAQVTVMLLSTGSKYLPTNQMKNLMIKCLLNPKGKVGFPMDPIGTL